MKVHELAKELGVKSSEVVKNLDGAVKNHLSIITDEQAEAVRASLQPINVPYVPSTPEEELAWRCLAQKSPYYK